MLSLKRSTFGVASLLVAAVLAACTTVSPASLVKLSRFSPLEFDPGAMRMALIVPESLIMKKGDISLEMGWQASAGPQHYLGSFDLDLLSGNAAVVALNGHVKSDQKIVVLTMNVADAQRMRDLQAQISGAKKAGLNGKGHLSMRFDGGCWAGAGQKPDHSLPVAAWLQAGSGEAYFPVITGVDLKDTLKQQGIDALPVCNAATRGPTAVE